MRSAAIGATVVTVLSMVAAVLVTPGIMRIAGHRVNAFRIGAVPVAGRAGVIDAVVRRVMARPLLAALTVAIVALVVTTPVLALPGNLIPPDPRQLPRDDQALRDYLAIRRAGFGPEIDIVLRTPAGTLLDKQRVTQIRVLQRRLERIPDAKFVVGPSQHRAADGSRATAPDAARPRRESGQRWQEAARRARARPGPGHQRRLPASSGLAQAASGARQLDAGALRARDGARRIATGNSQVRRASAVSTRASAGRSTVRTNSPAGRPERERDLPRSPMAPRGSTGVSARPPPGADRLAAGLREGRGELEALRAPAQTTERETRDAWNLLNAMTVGKSDPLSSRRTQRWARRLAPSAAATLSPARPCFPKSIDASLARLAGESGQAVEGAAAIADGSRQAADGARRLREGSGHCATG